MPTYDAGTAALRIKPSFTGFVAAVEAELSRYDFDLDIRVGADTSTAASEIANLQRAARESQTFRMDADTRTAASELENLQRVARENQTFGVDADTTAAAAQIAALNGMRVRVNASVDRKSLLGSLSGLQLNAGVIGLAALPAAATAATSIGVGLQQAAQSGLLLPGILAATGAGISTLVVGLDGMKDAFGEGAKAQKAYEGLSAEGRKLVDIGKSHSSQWDEIKNRVGGITLDGLSQPLDKVLTSQLPALDRGMSGLAGQFNAGFKNVLGELGNEQSTKALDTVFGNTSQAAGVLNGSISPIINSLRTLSTTGSTFLPQLAGGFTKAATSLDAFLTRSEKSGDLARWMKEGITAGGNLLSIIGNLGSSLASILRAGKTDGEGFLGSVDRITEGWSKFLKSAEGQSKLTAFFSEGREQLDKWAPIVKSVGGFMKTAYEASQAWSAILMPFLQGAASLLSGHSGLLKTVMIGYLAFRTISPIMTMVQNAISNTTARLATMQAAMATGAGTGAFRSGLSAIGTMLGPGGLVTAGVIGASALIGIMASKHQEAAQAARNQRTELTALRETLNASGDVTSETIQHTTKRLNDEGYLARADSLGVNPQAYVNAGLGLDNQAKTDIQGRINQTILEQSGSAQHWGRAEKVTKLSSAQIAQALQGIPEAVKAYEDAIAAAQLRQESGFMPSLADLKNELNDVGESAATLGGEMNSTGSQTAAAANEMRLQNEAMHGTFQLTTDLTKQFADLGVSVSSVPSAKTIVVNAPSAEALPEELRALAEQVTTLPGGKVEIILKDEVAKAGIAQLTAPAVKPVTITYAEATASGDWRAPMVLPAQPRAEGGPIDGGVAGKDSVPILAMPGEHMLTVADVARLGGQAGVYRWRAALASGQLQRFKDGGAVGPWDDNDELDLQKAQNAITAAEEDMRALDFRKDVPPSERRAAELKLEEARLEARKLGDRKAGGGTSSQFAPQAALPGWRSNSELDVEDAQSAVDQANTKRNQTYADPAATDDDKRAADRAYQRSQNSLAETNTKGAGEDAPPTLPGFLGKAGEILGMGILSSLGLEKSILSPQGEYAGAIQKGYNWLNKDQKGSSAGGYGYTPKNLPSSAWSDTQKAATESSRSVTGAYSVGAGAEQWRGLATQTLAREGFDPKQVDIMLAQIQSESGGNPSVVQQVQDVNSGGNEAQGLLQVVPGTFATYRDPSLPNDRTHPQANMVAALRYYRSRYGSDLSAMWGQGHGYATGGLVGGPGGPKGDKIPAMLSAGEFVVNAASTAAHLPWLQDINNSTARAKAAGVDLAGMYDSSAAMAQNVNAGAWPSASNRFDPVAIAQAAAPAIQQAGHDFSTTLNAQVADVNHLVDLAERRQHTKQVGVMAAMR